MDLDRTQDPLNHFAEMTAQPGRRAFLKTGLGVGFALAVQPVRPKRSTRRPTGS